MKTLDKWNIPNEQRKKMITALTEELTLLRVKLDISQSELAKIIGVSRQTYSAIETKKRGMTWNTYLSLVFFFDSCSETQQAIREQKMHPSEPNLNGADGQEGEHGIVGIPLSITQVLDEQALHAIRTVIMMEYARCENLTGDAVLKAFDGTTVLRQGGESRTAAALRNIREKHNE